MIVYMSERGMAAKRRLTCHWLARMVPDFQVPPAKEEVCVEHVL